MTNNETQIVSNANSEGFIKDWASTPYFSSQQRYGALGAIPRFSTEKVLSVVRNDPLVRGAIITLVDKTLESSWRITPMSKEKENILKKLRFSKVLKKVLYNLILYNNAYVEIVKQGDKVTDLNVLETSLMKIESKDNGDILLYFQEAGTRDRRPEWLPDKLTHYKIDDFTSNVWAETNIEAIYETILVKDYIRQWLQWFFGTNQMRPAYNIKDAAGVKVDELISYLKGSEKNLTKPLIFEGELDIKFLISFANEGKSLMDVLNWCDNQILMLLQVPPIAIGLPDASGRSNSVEQYTALNIRIHSLQESLEEITTYDLFKKIGFENYEFEFGVLDESTRKSVFENVQLMRNSQFSDEAIVEYLESQGVVFKTSKVLKTPEELALMSNKDLGTGNEGVKGNKSADAAQSRQRQGSDISKANKEVMVRNSRLEPNPLWEL